MADTQQAADLTQMGQVAQRLTENVERVVVGKHDEIVLVLAALISGGHVLLEDVPGHREDDPRARDRADDRGASFARIQCTPDLQPTDVTGLSIFDQKTREFNSGPGPIFANVVLVDEINRAMPTHPVGAARGDGRAPGDGRRRHARSCPSRSS